MIICVIKRDVLKINRKIYQILRRVIDENIFFYTGQSIGNLLAKNFATFANVGLQITNL